MQQMLQLLAQLQQDPGNQQLVQQLQIVISQLQVHFGLFKHAMG
jgi:hypothetical protein